MTIGSAIFWLLVYAAGVLLIQFGAWLALRREPTDHGQAVGTLAGCIIGLLWPVAVPYFLLTVPLVLAARLRRGRAAP